MRCITPAYVILLPASLSQVTVYHETVSRSSQPASAAAITVQAGRWIGSRTAKP